MTCSMCGRSITSGDYLSTSPAEYICDVCNFLLTGKKMNPSADFSYTTYDGITIWIKDLKINTMWKNDVAVPDAVWKDKTTTEALLAVRAHPGVWCSTCAKPLDEIKNSHFAGVYCDPCWETFKSKNSRTCGLCRQPLWKCYC